MRLDFALARISPIRTTNPPRSPSRRSARSVESVAGRGEMVVLGRESTWLGPVVARAVSATGFSRAGCSSAPARQQGRGQRRRHHAAADSQSDDPAGAGPIGLFFVRSISSLLARKSFERGMIETLDQADRLTTES